MMVTDTQNFQSDVIDNSFNKPILVDFWAEWCGPCRILGPILERMADKYKDRFELVKLNTDHFPEISQQYGIRGIPNVKLFYEGEVKGEFTGALPESRVEDWIKKNIPGKNDKLLEEAAMLISSDKTSEAQTLLKILKEKEPENIKINLLLAQIYLFNNPERSSEMLKNIDPAPEDYETANSINTISNLLMKKENNSLPDGDVKEKYVQAAAYLKEKNFDKALEEFIDVIRTDRSYDDDGARKACIAIFKYLGEDHPVTLKHRRNFGSALYV